MLAKRLTWLEILNHHYTQKDFEKGRIKKKKVANQKSAIDCILMEVTSLSLIALLISVSKQDRHRESGVLWDAFCVNCRRLNV